MLDIKSIVIWSVGYERGKKAKAAKLEAQNDVTMPLTQNSHRGRSSIHSIEQVRNKKINTIVFGAVFLLFLVAGLVFLLCHFVFNESSASCSRLTAVMTVSIIIIFLISTFCVNCYRKRKKRLEHTDEENYEDDEHHRIEK